MRVAIGSLLQRSDPARPGLTTLDAFLAGTLERDAALMAPAAATEIAGFLHVLQQAGVIAVPLLAAEAANGPPLMRESFHVLAVELVHRLAARLPVDAVLLATDAALRVEDEPDAAAELLERMRLVLPARTPIVVALHGAATARLADTGAIIAVAGDEEDRAAFGRRAARCAIDLMRHGARST